MTTRGISVLPTDSGNDNPDASPALGTCPCYSWNRLPAPISFNHASYRTAKSNNRTRRVGDEHGCDDVRSETRLAHAHGEGTNVIDVG